MAKATKVPNNVGTTYTTEDIIKAIAEKSKATDTPMSHKEATNALNLLKETINDALATGQKIQMTGFITIVPSYRDARKGNNVVTGEPMDIPESVVLNVKAGKGLKDTAKGLDATIVKALKGAKDK